MTINLEDYLNKIVEVELRGGAALVGKVIKFNTVFHIKFPYGYSSIPVSPDDIIKIKEIKEPEMTINLEEFVGKTVEVELRNGNVITGHKIRVDRFDYKYKYSISSYLNFYSQDGKNETHRDCDIIKIKETPTEPETMSNVIRSKIDVFTTEDERVEVTLDDDGISLTAWDTGVRQDLSIGSKDLVISVARCILEHYGVDLK